MHDAGRGFIEIGVVSHNDRVFAAHLGHDPFDPELFRGSFGRSFIDAQADLFRAGESDKACLRMIDDHVTNFRARTCHKVHHACRHAGFFKQLEKLVRNGRGIG